MEATTINEVLEEVEQKMKGSVHHFEDELVKVRAGKVHPQMLDRVKIDYYGVPTPVNQTATINVADARTLLVQPFEPKFISEIEKAVIESNLGFNPSNDGRQIRLVMPQLTEERRKNIVRQTRDLAEEARVAVRNHRREANDALKKLMKAGEPEDTVKAAEQEVQKMTDKYTGKIDEALEAKEAEIMKV
jgi:ribosome recycling factor